MATARRSAGLLLLTLLAGLTPVPTRQRSIEAVVLGVAQDGGVPHLGCRQTLCVEARKDPSRRVLVASLGLIDSTVGKRFLIDTTPDFQEQIELLGALPDAILLTHAHIGHYLGLAELGREVANSRGIPVYCTASMGRFLRENKPWSRLVERGNIALREIESGREFALTENLRVTAVAVPHRDEDSDTVAYLIAGRERRILWLPDIDRWDKWDRPLGDFAAEPSLTAFLDGTFYSADEVPGRSIQDIPHPLVPDTIALLSASGGSRAKIYFTHLNHTNRLLWDETAVAGLEARGFHVARTGERFPL